MFRVFRSLAEIGPDARPAAVAVGNFDGVHTGHRRLFRHVVKASMENGGFRPYSRSIRIRPGLSRRAAQPSC